MFDGLSEPETPEIMPELRFCEFETKLEASRELTRLRDSSARSNAEDELDRFGGEALRASKRRSRMLLRASRSSFLKVRDELPITGMRLAGVGVKRG